MIPLFVFKNVLRFVGAAERVCKCQRTEERWEEGEEDAKVGDEKGEVERRGGERGRRNEEEEEEEEEKEEEEEEEE
eukprot:CAMPEP_0201479144 /NCGR_PEP_ID=MMETSP0151_2-20130828/3869_1 /ASSEMBLY_ACC=CAM_ASM_000257 /TAXON_ID=200890 /ORGANISM="Paramoeba atlantica, Strain 621/1 / CCAP 1560/9" /LENGTH=75 /DNA_ID=CAMNT_0047860495 /DNA_START=444 /DNA_END=668 /DNA_ORIENTATION=+